MYAGSLGPRKREREREKERERERKREKEGGRETCIEEVYLSFYAWHDRVVEAILGNYFSKMCSGSEGSSFLRLIDSCITQL